MPLRAADPEHRNKADQLNRARALRRRSNARRDAADERERGGVSEDDSPRRTELEDGEQQHQDPDDGGERGPPERCRPAWRSAHSPNISG